MLNRNALRRTGAAAQRGLSLVELMVGIALGLFVVAGGISLFVSNAVSSRQITVETRINQDLRAAADLITRDLRRAGYWGDALKGTVALSSSTSATTPNPYRAVTPASSQIEYGFSRDTTEDNALGSAEQFGFRLNGGAVEMKVNSTPTWRVLTDPNTMTVNSLAITQIATDDVDVRNACSTTCCTAADVAAGTAGCSGTPTKTSGTCPTLKVRQYQVALAASAVSNTTIARTLTTRVRVRNDEFSGGCPV
jgi:prepilin peptidase dependent protein B